MLATLASEPLSEPAAAQIRELIPRSDDARVRVIDAMSEWHRAEGEVVGFADHVTANVGLSDGTTRLLRVTQLSVITEPSGLAGHQS